MSETKSEPDKDSEVKLCVWCFAGLTPHNSFEDTVCQACYRLLADAGMSDEKIFELGKFAQSRRKEVRPNKI